jgi:hypothetical protein
VRKELEDLAVRARPGERPLTTRCCRSRTDRGLTAVDPFRTLGLANESRFLQHRTFPEGRLSASRRFALGTRVGGLGTVDSRHSTRRNALVMSELWPLDVRARLGKASAESIRPFKCLLLMPFEARFDRVSEVIESEVKNVTNHFPLDDLPQIKRLDWVTSSNVIHQEIWEEIYGADLIFCDVTGYNANVLFEAGVSAGWKRVEQVIFIRDHFYRGQSPFDIAPVRYTEYSLTSDGIENFKKKVQLLTENVLKAFPDGQGSAPTITLPLHIDFEGGVDDPRIYTPPLAHRRVLNGALEFGSLWHFGHSWASIGKRQFLTFSLRFSARFVNPLPGAWIGIGFRSQHFYANYAHMLYLKTDGSIILVEPNEIPPTLYSDKILQMPNGIDLTANHKFNVHFDDKKLTVGVDDFSRSIDVATMPKVFGSGLIRFQSSLSWMSLISVEIE